MIKEQPEGFEEKMSNIKEMFRFRSTLIDPYT